MALGNHDYKAFAGNIPERVGAYKLEAKYYSYRQGAIRFVILDTNEKGVIGKSSSSQVYKEGEDYLAGLRAAGAMNVYPWNGDIGSAQINWLAVELKASRAAYERVIICSHHPPAAGPEFEALNTPEVITILKQHKGNVTATVSGHYHTGYLGHTDAIAHITVGGLLEPDSPQYATLDVQSNELRVYTAHLRSETVFKHYITPSNTVS